MAELAFAIFNGLASGMALFLVAAGVTLIFGMLKVLNFSHGAFFMLGAYITYALIGVAPSSIFVLVAASLGAGLAVGLCGYAADKVILRRLRGFDEHYVLIATFALLLVVTGATKLIWGLDYQSVTPPESLAGGFKIMGVLIPTYSLFVVLVGLLIFAVLDIGIHRMWIGKLVQGVVNDSWMLGLMGYNVPLLYTGTVVLSFLLAGVAGGLLLPNQTLSPTLGDTYVLLGFVTVIIGGLGNVRGAFVAALLMGLVDSVSVVAFNNFPGLAVYVAMVVMLLVRPQGLFGVPAEGAAATDWRAIFRFGGLPAQLRALVAARSRRPVPGRPVSLIDLALQAPRVRSALPLVAGVLVLGGLSAPFWANPGLVFIAGLVLIEGLFALSWHFLFAYAGVVSFGHAAFFAMGAYGVGVILKTAPGSPFLLLLAGAGLLGAVVAWIVGVIALKRSSGIYLAILTMSLAEICRIVVGYSTLLGRDDGLTAIPRPTLDFPGFSIELQSGASYYWFLWVAVGLLTAAIWWVAHSRYGRVLRCMQQDADRTSFIGANVGRYRLWSFVFSGGIAAVSGGLMAPWSQIVTPEATNMFHSTQPILNSLLGGVHSFWGPMAGAAAFAAINFFTRTLAGLSELVVGAILLVIVLAAPTGLIGLMQKFERLLKQRRAKAAAGPLP